MFAAREPRLPGIGVNLAWPLCISLGAAAVLLILQFSPRPFLATIAVVLWLVALIGAASFLQWREAAASRRRSERIAWRTAAILYLVGAAIIIGDPLLGNFRLVMLLAAALGIAGIARLTVALGGRRRSRVWLYLSGSATIAVALAIAFAWPFALVGPAIKALALDLLIFGATLILWRAGGGR